MREIKFRAWDKKKKKMLQPDHDAFDFITINDLSKLNLEFLQYTGLKDKNGKEIFEGDVLSFNDSVFECRWFDDGRWGFLDKTKKGEHYLKVGEAMERHVPVENHPNVLAELSTIVGNIYENPELLEKSV